MGMNVLILSAAGLMLGAEPTDTKAVAKELKQLKGTWVVESMEYLGKPVPSKYYKNHRLIIGDDTIVTKQGKKVLARDKFTINPAKTPRWIDRTVTRGPKKGHVIRGIYKLEGKTLMICAPDTGKKRPLDFVTKAESDLILVTLRRVKS
jgi:uncharacterized protein (TIGR03067 family)